MKQTIMIALCVLSSAAARKAVNKPQDALAFASGKAEAEAGACASYLCSAGFHPKADHVHLNVTAATDADCCEPTCARWNCSNGWKAHPGYLSNVGQSNEECCDKTCSMFTDCKTDTGVSTTKATEAGVTREECCEPTCHAHSCIGNWAQDPSKKLVVSSKNEECCTPSCQSVTCTSPNFIAHPDRGDKAAGTDPTGYCCQKSCSYYSSQCTAHTGIPSEKLLTIPDGLAPQTTCCETKCSGHTCDDGFVLMSGKLDEYVSMVVSGCCEMTCKAFECGKGWLKVPANDHQTLPSDDTCCEATCELYQCTFGFFNTKDPFKLNQTNRSLINCCEKSCESHTCPTGMSLRPGAETIPDAGGRNDEVCCEQHVCKELRQSRTPTSIQQGNSMEGLDCNHFDASEEMNCTQKYKLFNMSGNMTAVPCILDPAVKNCKMDDTNIATDCSELILASSEEA